MLREKELLSYFSKNVPSFCQLTILSISKTTNFPSEMLIFMRKTEKHSVLFAWKGYVLRNPKDHYEILRKPENPKEPQKP